MNVNPEDFEELVYAANEVVQEIESKTWEKADIAQEAATMYGRLKELCDRVGQDYSYWKKLSYIAGRYDKETRDKFSELTFRHFEVVVKLPNRVELLDLAAKNSWSAGRLKRELQPKVDKNAELAEKVTVSNFSESEPELHTPEPSEIRYSTDDGKNFSAQDVDAQSGYEQKLSFADIADALQWYWLNDQEALLQNEKVVDVIRLVFQDERRIVFDNEKGFSLSEPAIIEA